MKEIEDCEMLVLEENLPVQSVIGYPVAALTFQEQISLMMQWAKEKVSKVVCIANVHMLVEAYQNKQFSDILLQADLLTPDGMPLVWMLKLQGVHNQDRVAGLDVMLSLCKQASAAGESVFFLGSQASILEKMQARLKREFPDLKVAGMEPLPFRPLTPEEDAAIIEKLNQSGAGLLFLSLGCPKQEKWMAEHKDKVHMVMLGLGAVFPLYAGIHRRAPRFVRLSGFEWLYRLLQEPKRLAGRYGTTIPVFIWLALKQLLSAKSTTLLDKNYSLRSNA
ncbi:WecB/TagA/CpsF family glycosyltransferase [Leptolyngbya sp. AN02str]|uniref:WecB/TagA/CpsF family glycosyltransferase n=1 Tax=Leptolyngbya sp. AN02str TaxID=3423363 RepID=UPI003D316C9A